MIFTGTCVSTSDLSSRGIGEVDIPNCIINLDALALMFLTVPVQNDVRCSVVSVVFAEAPF